MKRWFRLFRRLAHGILLLAGFLALLAAAGQFTNLPWRAYARLAAIPAPAAGPPTHILVMGGSGIPGNSGLMRTFYAAEAAARYPGADVLVAMPRGAAQSAASRAYLDELRLRGVAGGRLRLLDGGRNTREQALRVADYLADRPAACLLLVTDPEHICRSAASLRKVCGAGLIARPAFPVSIEDPLPWRAAELDGAGPAPAGRAAVPDVGTSLRFRYNLWANLGYSLDVLREAAALLYYRLRGWI